MLRRTYEFAGETNFPEHRGAMPDTGSGVLNYRGKRIELTKMSGAFCSPFSKIKGKAVSRDSADDASVGSRTALQMTNTLTVNVTACGKTGERQGLTDFIQTKRVSAT